MKKKFKCEVDCANCAQKLQDALSKLDGVDEVSVNFMTQKLTLVAADEKFDEVFDAVVKAVEKGEIKESRIDESVKRILALKK